MNEKMLSGELYNVWDDELYKDRLYCQKVLNQFNDVSTIVDNSHVLKSLIHSKGEFMLEKPFYCRYGYHIFLGIDFYGKSGLKIDDSGEVRIGSHVIIGENVSILTTCYPYNEKLRMQGKEYTKAVRIHDYACIGACSIIYPGVKINQGAIIQPGSVVKEDVPPYVVAGGNPCQVIKEITPKDVRK